jgi:predicted ATPase/DNA-binding CsgD family transcriptional regulator
MAAVYAMSSEQRIPVPRTPLVGRERERASVGALLCRADVPLVTLTGPGGVGKTRLALHVGGGIAGEFEGGAAFVSLGAIREPSLVLPAIAQSLGLAALSQQSPRTGLLRFLQDRDFLLVLDNFEQVISAAGEIADLLDRCPRLTLLVTSRESLKIDGEHEYPLSPLELPDRSSPNELITSESARLFVQRAQAVKPDFTVDADDARIIASICISLDGLPLAIELAAARIKILTPQALLSRLVDRLTLLKREGRDVPERLRTLRDAVGWSYDLLSDDERLLFRRLSVFAGGFTTDSAEAVLRRVDPRWVGCLPSLFEAIGSLLDKSLLVRTEPSGDEPRFRMLETIRAYGLEQLDAHGEVTACREALSAWMVAFTRNAFEEQFGPRQKFWSTFFDAELDNVRALLEWHIERNDAEAATRLVTAVTRYWHVRANYAEGWRWGERVRALEAMPSDPSLRCRNWLTIAWHKHFDGDQVHSFELAQDALSEAELAGDGYVAAQSHHVIGVMLENQGKFEEAMSHFIDALDFYVANELDDWHAYALNSLGHSELEIGRLDSAEAHLDQALELFMSTGNTLGAGLAVTNLAKLARRQGQLDRAELWFQQALKLRWEHGDKRGLAGCLRGLGMVHVLTGHYETGAQLLGAAETLYEAIGAPLHASSARYDEAVATLHAQLSRESLERAWRKGRTAPIEETISAACSATYNHAPSSNRTATGTGRFELTGREIEVLCLVRQGRSNREIGDELYVSERTAQTHVQNILVNMGVNSRTAAAARAVSEGMID